MRRFTYSQPDTRAIRFCKHHSIMFSEHDLVCRLCLNVFDVSRLLEIFGSGNSDLSLAKKISSTLKFEVTEDDNLPKYVCKECTMTVDFMEVCHLWSVETLNYFSYVQNTLKTSVCNEFSETRPSLLLRERNSMMEESFLLSLFKRLGRSISSGISLLQFMESSFEQIRNNSDNTTDIMSEGENTALVADGIQISCLDKKRFHVESETSSNPHRTKQEIENQHNTPIHNLEEEGTATNKNLNVPPPSISNAKCPYVPDDPHSIDDASWSQADDGNEDDIDDYILSSEKSSKLTLVCPECHKSFSQKSLLFKHLVTHVEVIDNYQCHLCKRIFISTSDLQRHSRAHLGLKPYHCTKCSKYFSQKNLLDTHMNIHEGRKSFLCELCGQSISTRPNLRMHIQNFHASQKNKPFKCEDCGVTFARKHHLDNHTTLHDSFRPHQCTTCGKTFKRISVLKEHELGHSDERRYKCGVCEKRFKTKRVLNVHKVLHTDLLQHQCTTCSKSYARRSGLVAHMKTHSN